MRDVGGFASSPPWLPPGWSPPLGSQRAPPLLLLQFGRYLLENQRPEWATQYVDYKGLKDLIKKSVGEAKQVRGVGTAGSAVLGAAACDAPPACLA